MKSINGRMKKALGMILCGVIFIMSFALINLGSVKAYADTALDSNEFTLTLNTQLPESGKSTAITSRVITVPDGCHYTAEIMEESVWVSSGAVIDNTFVGGKTYQVQVLITMEEGFYILPSQCRTSTINGISNCYGGIVERDTDDYDKIKKFYAFVNYECEPKNITITRHYGDGTSDTLTRYEGTNGMPGHEHALPDGKKFAGWAIDDPDATRLYLPDEEEELRADTDLYAKYVDKGNYALNIDCDSNKGSVKVTERGRDINPNAIPEGTDVTLLVFPKSGWKVSGLWCPITSTITLDNKQCDFTMMNSDMPIKVYFEKESDTVKEITLDAGTYCSVDPSVIMTDTEGYLKNRDTTQIELPRPTVYGATFLHWSKTPNGEPYDPSERFTEDTTFYAVYDGTPVPGAMPDSGEPAHVHHFVWQTITEPTKYTDGLEGEVCSCGATRNTQPISAMGYALYQYAVPMINASKSGQTITLDLGEWNSFPKSFMEKIAAKSAQNVTFVLKYKWNHVKQEITIPAFANVDTSLDWYGPAKMAELYGAN